MSNEKLFTLGWEDYELIDAGGGKKLERWGKTITIRPEVQAYFKSEISFSEWSRKAHWEFIQKGNTTGIWKRLKENAPDAWSLKYENLEFQLKLTKFKHLGLFPEQKSNWEFIQENLKAEDKFLNLFAYTGAASCVARRLDATTLHVDSVKQLISWAKENMEASGLSDIKWVHEDALKFAERELKRGNRYKGVLMDPPAWGIGAKKEKWKLEDKLELLIQLTSKLLEKDGFLILNTYSPKIDLKVVKQLSDRYIPNKPKEIKELWMTSTSGKKLYYGNVLRVGGKRR